MVTYVLNIYELSIKYPLINSLFGSSYKSLNQKRIIVFFINSTNTNKTITFRLKKTIPIRLQFELFFLNECPYGFVLLKSDVVGIRLKKIASIGF